MTIVRAPRPAHDFTILPNAALRDPDLSYRARGVLAYVLSMPDNWRTNAVTLARQGLEGRDAIRTAINELIVSGYARRVKSRRDDGTFETELHFYDRRTYVGKLCTTRGQTDQPTTENPASDSQASKEELLLKTIKDSQTYLGSEPKLCGYCQGNGHILDGFGGLPMICPDCKGDGIQRG